MQGDNLPSLAEVIQLHNNHSIGTMWLYDPNPEVLRALVNSGISMSLGAKNEDLHNLASSVEAAKSWIDAHVECYQGVNIKYIVAGNEVIPGELAQRVLLAMQNLQSALSGSSFSSVVMTVVVSGQSLELLTHPQVAHSPTMRRALCPASCSFCLTTMPLC